MRTRAYERIAETLLRGQPKAKRFARVWEGRFLTGTKSLHLTPQSRKWRTFWRLKSQRQTTLEYYWRSKS
jgi:hypothetical protein